MAQNKTLELSIKIAGKVDKSLTAAINNTNNLMGSLTTTMSKVGTAGLAAMGALTTATIAGLAKATDTAREFEASMADVVKYVDGLADATGKISDKLADNGKTFAENYGTMKDAILDLSTQIPFTANELTELAAAAGQSGKAMEDLIKTDASGNITGFLRDVAMAGVAMDISADQAGNWAAKWEKAFNMDHSQVMVLLDQINYLGANSATTAAEIAEAVNSAASLGQIAGADVATTAALADAMLATGVASDRVGTSIKRTYTNLSKGASATKAQKEMWQELGMSAEGIAKSMQVDSVGTLLTVFDAINNLPDERQVAALSTLFGQWAIEGNAKIVGNMDVFTDALKMVSDPNLYAGSMEREFIIKASTSESIDAMLANTKYAMAVEIGDAFLPAKKEFSLAMIDFLNTIRGNMPELEQLAGTLGELASGGVAKLADVMDKSLPYIQKGLDYLANNGPEVAETLGKIAAVFVGMKFAPGIESLLSGAGSLLMGTPGGGGGKRSGGLVGGISNLFKGGQKAGGAAGGLAAAFGGAASGNGFFTTLSAMASSLISGNGIKGTTGLLDAAAGTPGLLSGYQGVGSAIRNRVGGSGVGQYLGGIFSSVGDLGTTLGNTKAGGAISGVLNKLTLPLRKGIAGVGAAATIQGSIFQQNISGLLGKAGGFLGGIASSGPGKAIGGLLGGLGSVASSGAGVLGSVWGPIASGFGSIFTGAAPVIGVISAIIAVVSILGDNIDSIRGIVQNVFGDEGLAIFDSFLGVLQNVGDFISGLFVDGGVAEAMAPLRDSIVNLFGPEAGAAFDGLTTILQSVMGIVGQIVNFANTTVKPIIQEIFGFLTTTVFPTIMNLFTQAAPYIAGIISGIGSAVMTGMQIIGSAIQASLPVVEKIVSVIMSIASVVVPAVLAGINALASGIGPILESIKTIFDGLISFITGVFTGNWTQAWEGVKQIFAGAFNALEGLLKTPVNAVIALINKAISGINGLGLTIPDWVPVIGGKSFSINIPEIPMLAKGGFTDGVSIAGEAGREAVISFQRGVRAQNIATWAQAGRMLGVSAEQALHAVGGGNVVELKEVGGGSDDGPGGGFTFAPNIIIQGNADRDVIDEALRQAKEQFEAWYEQMVRKRARMSY